MNTEYSRISKWLHGSGVELVAVSKTRTTQEVMELYNAGHRNFGENRVQELRDKYEELPKDISWHMIGHLQTNKVKYISPWIKLIQSVDSFGLLLEIDRQAEKSKRVVDVLLQIYIADEETKFGMNETELDELLNNNAFKQMNNIRICGLMGMATNTEDEKQVRKEFRHLKLIFDKLKNSIFNRPEFSILSMGMSGDYKIAVEEGSNMVRIGSLIFGERK